MDACPLKPVAIFSSVNFGPGKLRLSLNLLLSLSMHGQRFLANKLIRSVPIKRAEKQPGLAFPTRSNGVAE
jgi:hypothetical protein